ASRTSCCSGSMTLAPSTPGSSSAGSSSGARTTCPAWRAASGSPPACPRRTTPSCAPWRACSPRRPPVARRAAVERVTSETSVRVVVDLDAPPPGAPAAETGHGFVDHLLEQLARHGRFHVSVSGRGDLHIDVHHLAEDVGI